MIVSATNLKEIESLKYKDYYLIYIRKSTDDDGNQKNTLAGQKNSTLRFAKDKHLKIADVTFSPFCKNGIITEKHSSFKEDELMGFDSNGNVQHKIDRPKFYELVTFLNKKFFKGVIFLSWDRASRNPTDNNILKKLIKNKLDIRFAMTEYDKSSSGALHMDIDSVFSEHHSRVTSEKVSITLSKNREAGLCSYQAPVGYINEGNVDWKPFDPIRAPIVKRFFELASEGWSLNDISKWANEQGFNMPARRDKRSREEMLSEDDDGDINLRPKIHHAIKYTTIQQILRNRFYVGEISIGDDQWIKSNRDRKSVV